MTRRSFGYGFTLVEVVIAMTLVSFIMLGMLAALRTFGDTGARLEARAMHGDDMRQVSGFLRQALGEASTQQVLDRSGAGQVLYFNGTAQAVEWLAPMPARHGVGGLHRLRLFVREDVAGRRLALQFVPFVASDENFDWSAEPALTLQEGLDAFLVQYQRLGADEWRDDWDDPAVLPGRLRLSIAGGGGPWPELLIAVLAAEPGQDINAVQQ